MGHRGALGPGSAVPVPTLEGGVSAAVVRVLPCMAGETGWAGAGGVGAKESLEHPSLILCL